MGTAPTPSPGGVLPQGIKIAMISGGDHTTIYRCPSAHTGAEDCARLSLQASNRRSRLLASRRNGEMLSTGRSLNKEQIDTIPPAFLFSHRLTAVPASPREKRRVLPHQCLRSQFIAPPSSLPLITLSSRQATILPCIALMFLSKIFIIVPFFSIYTELLFWYTDGNKPPRTRW